MQNCKVCDASWNIAKKIDICPFCGADLREKKIMTSIEDAFQVIVDKHGKEVLKESRKFLGLLSDYAPELIKERNLVKMAVEVGAYKAIYEASSISDVAQKQEVKKYALVLHETFFIDEIWAEKVMIWCSNMISGNLEKHNYSVVEDKVNISLDKRVMGSNTDESNTNQIENNIVHQKELSDLPKKKLTYCMCRDLWSLYEAYDYASKTFIVPEGVTDITKDCLDFHWNMEQLIIPESVQYIEHDALKHCRYLKKIEVNEKNKNYFVLYGKLIEKKSYDLLWP